VTIILPSGLNGATNKSYFEEPVYADYTVLLDVIMPALLLEPSEAWAGHTFRVKIGIPEIIWKDFADKEFITQETMADDVAFLGFKYLSLRESVGPLFYGTKELKNSVLAAAEAALKCGSPYVFVDVDSEVEGISRNPEIVEIKPGSEDSDKWLDKITAFVLFAKPPLELLEYIKLMESPVILIGEALELIEEFDQRKVVAIVTPSELVNFGIKEQDEIAAATAFASKKGVRGIFFSSPVVFSDRGERTFIFKPQTWIKNISTKFSALSVVISRTMLKLWMLLRMLL